MFYVEINIGPFTVHSTFFKFELTTELVLLLTVLVSRPTQTSNSNRPTRRAVSMVRPSLPFYVYVEVATSFG